MIGDENSPSLSEQSPPWTPKGVIMNNKDPQIRKQQGNAEMEEGHDGYCDHEYLTAQRFRRTVSTGGGHEGKISKSSRALLSFAPTSTKEFFLSRLTPSKPLKQQHKRSVQ